MSGTGGIRVLAVVLTAVLVLGSGIGQTSVAGTVSAQTAQGTTLVVDGEGDDPDRYATIQAAVDDASDGDRVEVRPGTYRESVSISKDVEVVAPDGATLDGADSESSDGFALVSSDGPELRGFTVINWQRGVRAASGSWVVEDVAIRGADTGIDGKYRDGDFEIRNVTVRDTEVGISLAGTSGDWTIRNSTIENSSSVGVKAHSSSGDWTILDSAIRDTPFQIDAIHTTGAWEVHYTSFVNYSEAAIEAQDSPVEGDATRNWWGTPGEPHPLDCFGNVTCADPLSEPPGEGGDSIPAAIAGDDGVVDTSDLQQAIQYWASQTAVPGTNGGTIDTQDLQGLIQAWAAQTVVD